jgi:hypothetical protein
VQLVGFDPSRRRLVAVAAVTSAGQLFQALAEMMGDAGLGEAVRGGPAAVEVYRWRRTARGWTVEVYPVTAVDFAHVSPVPRCG